MQSPKTRAETWLWLGVAALGVAGLFAVVLVAARTPQLAVFTHLFSVSLVIHVDLSVLMWFFSMLGMAAALVMHKQPTAWNWPRAPLIALAASALLMALSPLDSPWEVIKSNYIPVLHNGVFLLALGLAFAGLTAMLLPVLAAYSVPSRWRTLTQVELGWLAACVTTAMALVAFVLSARALPAGLSHEEFYETLFWAGGHILQFAFTLLVMAAWLALLDALNIAPLPRRWVSISYGLTLLGAGISFAGFLLHPADSGAFTYHQTRVMIEFGGIGASLLAVMVIVRLASARFIRTQRAYASTLIMSLVLFFAGGALGLLISGQNVTIPAHYHGAIVGITLGLMGLAYSMLPRFGYPSVAANRLAFWQPIVYGVGQLMHIGGLAYSGGYGVLRKTAGTAANSLTPDVKIAMGFMGLGGLIAMIGGLLFVIVMLRAFARRGQPYPSV